METMRPVLSNVANVRVDSYVESAEYILERRLYVVGPVGEACVEAGIIYVIPSRHSWANLTYVRHIKRERG